jgi:hypothetical protein
MCIPTYMLLTTCRNTVVLACLAGTCVAYGQRFSYGVKGGASLNDPTNPENSDESKRYVIGGTVELRIWGGLAAEADFLYRRNGLSYSYTYSPHLPNGDVSAPVSFAERRRLDVFEIPVLGKYYFRHEEKLQPFVLTGYSFRKALGQADTSVTTLGTTTQSSGSSWLPLDVGASFGAGLRWRAGRVSLTPEIRYTYWNSHPDLGVSKHQADFLFGISF